MTRPAQTFETHRYNPVAWNVAWLGAAAAFVLTVWAAVRAPSLRGLTLVLLAFVVAMTVSLLRVFALRLQNRIIRLEMQVRLARLAREEAMTRLALPQIVALRFASDAELPALIDRTIAEQLSPEQIKRAVTDWQGDFLRT